MRSGWLGHAIVASLALLPIWTVYVVWDAFSPLGYANLMGLYLTIAVFALYIAMEGWRHAGLAFPVLAAVRPIPTAVRNWTRQGEVWAARVRAEGWAADPELSLSTLSARLATNTAYLSRALNEGLGLNFSTFINGLRAEHVADSIRDGDRRDLILTALDAGFASKASFNRAFKARFGVSPSAFRQKVSDRENQTPPPENEAARRGFPRQTGGMNRRQLYHRLRRRVSRRRLRSGRPVGGYRNRCAAPWPCTPDFIDIPLRRRWLASLETSFVAAPSAESRYLVLSRFLATIRLRPQLLPTFSTRERRWRPPCSTGRHGCRSTSSGSMDG